MRRLATAGLALSVVWTSVSLLGSPIRGAADDKPKGPVRTVDDYGAKFQIHGGQWVETNRHLVAGSRYGRKGELLERRYYDSQGRLDLEMDYRYDSLGRKTEEIEQRYPREPDQPPVERRRATYTYSRNGRIERIRRYESNGALSATQVFRYDAKGRKTAEGFLYPDGSWDTQHEAFKYNAKGQLVEHLTHDTRGVPVRHVYTRDARGNVTRDVERWKGDAVPTATAFRYDARGNQIEVRYHATGERFSERYTYAYDDAGNVVEKARYRFGDLTLWLKTRYAYDPRGNVTEEAAFGPEGGVDSRTTYTYLADGRIAEEARYGPGDQFSGKSVSAYDHDGRLVELANYDGASLCSKSVFAYGEGGRLARETQYDPQGRAAGRYEYAYDEQGRKAKRVWYEPDGMASSTWTYEYAKGGGLAAETYSFRLPGLPGRTQVTRYDEQGRQVEQASYSQNGSLEKQVRCRYGPEGRKVEETQEYGDGSLAERTAYVYNGKGQLAEQSVYFGDGSLRLKTRYAYDSAGRKTEAVEYLGSRMEKTAYQHRFDSRGNLVQSIECEVTTRDGKRYLRPFATSEREITYWQ